MTRQTAICSITNQLCPTPHTECGKCSRTRDVKLPEWALEQLHNNKRQHIERLELPLEEFMKKLGAIELN